MQKFIAFSMPGHGSDGPSPRLSGVHLLSRRYRRERDIWPTSAYTCIGRSLGRTLGTRPRHAHSWESPAWTVLNDVEQLENEHDNEAQHRQLDQRPKIEPRSSTESEVTKFHSMRLHSSTAVHCAL